MTGRIWMILAVSLLAVLGLILLFAGLGDPFERWESAWLRAVASIRTGWLTTLLVGVNSVLASRWTVRILRLGTLVALVGLRRWRHLFTFLGSVIAVELVAYQLSLLMARPRPVGIRIIGSWVGFSMPSYPVAALAVTLVGMVYALLPAGRPRSRGKWAAGIALLLFGFARIYLALDHPTDVLAAVILGVGIPMVAFRFFTPNQVFPVTYPARQDCAPGCRRRSIAGITPSWVVSCLRPLRPEVSASRPAGANCA